MLSTAPVAIATAAPATPAPATPQTKTTAKPPQTRASLARARNAAAARRAAAAREAAARERRLLLEAQTPKFTEDELGNTVPLLRAAAGVIYDKHSGRVLWQSNMHEQRPIASLSKIMTAVVFMNDDPDLDQRVGVTRVDLLNASVTYLRAGELVSYRDLLHLTLVASDNAAARVLARTSEGGTAGFVARMNKFAVDLGLTNTHYVEPSGLDARNVSSAYDQSNLITHASQHPLLTSVLSTEQYTVRTSSRTFTIHSTNRLLNVAGVDVVSAKTGFIKKAGYCLATILQAPQGAQLAVVVLGAANSMLRFYEAQHLLNWAVGTTRVPGGNDAPASR